MDVSQLDKNRGRITQLKRYEEMFVKSKLQGTGRHNEPLQAVVENKLNDSALNESNNSVLERNRAFLQYIATLANSNNDTDEFNYEFVTALIQGGAQINTADQYEQTIFHEVARSWNVDVARFLLEHGCDINKKDSFGRTPLHVSSAVDHVQMAKFLLENNADMDARTVEECQAPIHFAAKNGAMRSLKVLLAFHANIDSPDGKKRTPLQLAAEWTRVETAKVLIDEGAASCLLDSSGNCALSVLIDRLPNLALEALNQLHATNVITMTNSYYLQYLEASRQKVETKAARTPLETAVTMRKFEVVTHPVMQRLIHNKWIEYGRRSTIFDLLFHVVFGVAWTSICMRTPLKGKQLYIPADENVWRIILGVIVLLMTAFDIGRHIYATRKSQKSRNNWIDWRIGHLQDDMRHCHPRWPQEKKLIKYEIKRVQNIPLFDAFGAWFYMEWIILILILATIATHFLFYSKDTSTIRNIYARIMTIVNLLVWLRLLKYVRPFPGIGTLVIILGQTAGDFVNWAFLFILLLIPFSAAFWINFGSISVHPVKGFDDTNRLIHSVFQIAVGDDFNFEGLAEADPVMSRILIVLYVIVVTIVTLNLLIALLSDTFSRVYSNAIANTIMQRAIKVVDSERTLTKSYKMKYREHMNTNCSPEVIKMTFDGKNAKGPTERAGQEMYMNIRNIKKTLDDRFSKVYGRNKTSDFDAILNDMNELKDRQDDFSNDLMSIRRMVKTLEGKGQKNSRRRTSNEPEGQGDLFTNEKQQRDNSPSWRTTIARFFSTNNENETKLSGSEARKRPRRGRRHDQSRSPGKEKRRKSEKTRDDKNGAVPSDKSIVLYNHGHGNSRSRATGGDSGLTNPTYHNETLDDISI